jgi:hypothetical protein
MVKMPAEPRMPRSLRCCSFAAVVLLAGCTAARAEVSIVTADQALGRAREQDADTLAVYEYTMATRYLEKAKEEAGYSDYKAAQQLADKSANWADQAIIAIESGGRGTDIEHAEQGLSDQGLSDQPVEPRPDTPPEPPPTLPSNPPTEPEPDILDGEP